MCECLRKSVSMDCVSESVCVCTGNTDTYIYVCPQEDDVFTAHHPVCALFDRHQNNVDNLSATDFILQFFIYTAYIW